MIYILDLLEFQVLAAARKMEAYYGFAREEPARQEVYYTVYQMVRSGILKKEGDGLVIQQPFSGFIGRIASSPGVLVADRGQYALPRQCVYFADGQYVCVENCRQEGSGVSLCAMGEEEFLLQLQELNQLPKPRLDEKIGAYDFAGYWKGHIQEELWETLQSGVREETEEYLGYGQVHSVFTMRDKVSGAISRRMVLVGLPLEYCMALQDIQKPGEASLEPYTREKAWEVLKSWWKDGEG